jgi:pyruvate dehydrogenase E1 component alpha subunit
LYIGQEAVLAGISEAIRPTDRMVTAYRDHAHPLVLGTDPKHVMAELYGRVTGTSKGKGGSMHMFDKERNLFGGHGIVGGQIGLGAGIAFADKYRKEDHVTLCFFGDGAARQGILHETFNMAMTWKLPVIFIIENNKYAMGTSVERTSNVTDLETMGASYRMPSATVDGMSPEAVCDAIAIAAERGRKGEGTHIARYSNVPLQRSFDVRSPEVPNEGRVARIPGQRSHRLREKCADGTRTGIPKKK